MRERNIENEILKQNKIPGCDQLTRPEEVKALSKYLKSIRTTQENHTSLEKDNLELPGRTTGRIPEINSLEDYIEGLDGVRGIKSLYKESSREPLSDNRNSDSAENHGLYTEKTRENLYDPRKTELEKHREDIVNKKNILEPTLEDRREELTEEPKELKSLGTEKLNLEGVRDVRNLYINTKENLKVPEKDLELGKERESLIDNHNLELDPTRIDLEGFKDLSYKEQLEVDSKNELDTTRISLEKTIETSELSSYREDLKETPEELDKLEDHREKLNSGKDNLKELEDTKVKLRNPVDDAELSKTKVSLERTVEDKELETYRENLRKTPEELDELENYKESLRSGEELKSLPEDKITLGGTVKVLEELGNTKIDLEGTEESEISTLEDYRENLSVEDNNSLEDTRVDLEDTKESEPKALENERIDLENTEESEISTLEDYRENLSVEDNNSLEDTRIDLTGTKEAEMSELEDYLDDLENTKDYEASELEDTRIDLTGTKEFEPKSLEDERINLEGTKEYESSSLEDERIDLKGTEEAEPESLEDFIDKLEDTRDFELEDEKLELPETSGDGYEGYTPLGPEELDSLGGNINNFYDSLLEVPEIADAPRQSGDYTPLGPEELDSLGGDLGNFYDSILEVPETDNENYLSPEEVEKIIENPEQQYNYKDKLPEVAKGNSAPRVETEGSYNYLSPEEVEKIIENPTYFYNQQKEIPDAQAPDGQEIYKYSENPELSSEQVEGPPMKLPKFGLESLNLSNYLRWTAEKAVGWTGVHGEARQLLVNETLAGLVVARDELEKVTKSNRYRLPGNDGGLLGDLVSGGVSGALDNLGDKLGDAVNSIVGSKSVDISNPLNRPDENKFKYNGFEEANTRSTSSNASNPIKSQSVFSYDEIELLSKITNEGAKKNSSSSFWKKAGSALKDMALGSSGGERTYSFKNNYISGKGILITLEELCGISSDTDDTNTVEGLYNVLKSSPFITTPDKFTSTGYSNYNIQTLDTNAFWEIALEPYAGPENGDLNYLPGIHEINIRNIVMHGVNTAYNKWIPFTSFDLQKSKMTSKTLSLYDGEISYPVSMEFTNELRITIADDQYKSWRRYFEECAKAAIYNSEGHTSDYYILPPDEYSLTAIDTNNVCIAMYKNICFRCRIYVMTPQYSTIQKFDLLLVMKDFSEEYTGDIGDGAGDLTVSFSIVGENPNEGKIPEVKVIQHKAPDNSSKTDYGSIVESGVNSVMKLIK
nr:MAG TPA: chromosome segregation protein [Bacteriophage sp.]